MRSIFRYPGGKTRRAIQEWIIGQRPPGTLAYREPFVGGGGVFFALPPESLQSRWINDANAGLMEVYRALSERPDDFIAHCKAIAPAQPGEELTAEGVEGGLPQNKRLKAIFDEVRLNENCDQAFRYFFVNRTVFGGRVNYDRPSRLYFSKPVGWNIVKGHHLERAAKHIEGSLITCGDYERLFLEPGEGVWIYADPPYVRNSGFTGNSRLYQHHFTQADHERLAAVVKRSPHKIALSYDDDPEGLVRSLYSETRFHILEAEWAYCGSTNDRKDRGKELLILNYQPNREVTLFSALPDLSVEEEQQLAIHETIIERNSKAFVETGESLRAIRDGKLHRRTHRTFAAYCQERWGMSRAYAYQVIQAAAVIRALKVSAMADTLPRSERQARELTRLQTPSGDLDTEQVMQAWSRALEEAGGRIEKVTAARVREHVDAIRPRIPRTQATDTPEQVPDGLTSCRLDVPSLLRSIVEASPEDQQALIRGLHLMAPHLFDEELVTQED